MSPWSKQNDNTTLYIIIAAVAVLIVICFFYWRNSSTPSVPPVIKEEVRKVVKPSPPNPDHETPLTDDTQSKPTIVMFYADWCGHSRSALPEWKKLEDALKGSPVACLSLDDARFKKEMMEHGIKGYPTIRMYPNGFPSSNFVDYPGPRTAEAMLDFIKSGGRS